MDDVQRRSFVEGRVEIGADAERNAWETVGGEMWDLLNWYDGEEDRIEKEGKGEGEEKDYDKEWDEFKREVRKTARTIAENILSSLS